MVAKLCDEFSNFLIFNRNNKRPAWRFAREQAAEKPLTKTTTIPATACSTQAVIPPQSLLEMHHSSTSAGVSRGIER